ncbi:hypothetical protein [Xenorhabdus bovienii]|uniref:Knr4/Smi1-like domain-containing protein n=1 Tax=Xenorhabdus bovienii str. Intermedium TaxID=1379677 RepID=A0A077QHR3_XENBV|nr:hypothetical protein [Xenorhabdus bovienii]CDH33044.1 conserved hypothetical protein [Xenorhabdus bovienii str. Intermedium]
MINQTLINYLHSVFPELEIDTSYIRGYYAEEIPKFERFYDIEIKSQLYDFLICMGRCSGGFFGDIPLAFYHEQKTARGGILFQEDLRDELGNIQRHDLIVKKPFFISVESYTQYFFVLTKSDNPDLVYRYDENEETVQATNWSFNEYLRHVVNVYTRNHKVKAPFDLWGELIII